MRAREIAVLAAILVGAAGWRAAELTPLHGWSDDGSLYLRHAENLLAGRPYASVLHAPSRSLGFFQMAYPAGLPLTLVPIVAWRGIDWLALKWAMWCWYTAALVSVAVAIWRLARPWETAAVVAVLAVHAESARLAEHVNSDFPALCMQGIWLAVVSRGDSASRARAAAAGVLGSLACAMRSAGLWLVAAGALHSVWRWGRWTRFAVISSLTAAVGIAMRMALTPTGGTYGAALGSTLSLMTLRRNAIQLPLELSQTVWPGGWLLLAILPLGLYGAWRLLVEESRPVWLAFAALYVPAVFLWPFSDPARFLLPVLPLWLLALVRGAGTVGGRPLAWVLVAAAMVTQVRADLEFRRHRPEHGLNEPAALALYGFVERETPPSAVIACRKPRTVSLFTNRRSLAYDSVLAPEAMRADLCVSGATHLVSSPEIFKEDRMALEPFLARYAPVPVYRSGPYAVYDLKHVCSSSR